MEQVIITRHSALVDLLKAQGVVGEGENLPVLAHASVEDVQGKHVIGVLPLWLASKASLVTEVTLAVPPEARGRELTLEELRGFYKGIKTYKVYEVPTPGAQLPYNYVWEGSWADTVDSQPSPAGKAFVLCDWAKGKGSKRLKYGLLREACEEVGFDIHQFQMGIPFTANGLDKVADLIQQALLDEVGHDKSGIWEAKADAE